MEVKIALDWKEKLVKEFEKEYFKNLVSFVKKEVQQYEIYPPGKEIFRAFDYCSFQDLKVVIIGQDPYHGVGQANGLCFSVKENIAIPPSLLNIFKEIKNDLGISHPGHGNLERWAKQGVLLLNSILTVRANEACSHQNKGWEMFTDAVIQLISEQKKDVVFLLWGAYAQKKGLVIDESNHFVLKSVHPSPLSASRGFFGNHHFSKVNDYLDKKGYSKIIW